CRDAAACRPGLQIRPADDVAVDTVALPGVGSEELPFADAIKVGGVALVGVLGGLVLVDNVSNAAFSVLGPDIQRSLHLSDLALGVVGALGGLVIFAAAIPLGYLRDRVRRTTLVGVCSLLWSCFVLL